MIGETVEEVLVVPRVALFHQRRVSGFETHDLSGFLAAIAHHKSFRPRAQVEEDASLKQIIPYMLVRHRTQLFLFQRAPSGGEARLHGKYSIGVGGHINRRDVEGAADPVAAGLRRELGEELRIEAQWQARLVGVLNDESNAVGEVHFGLVHVIEVERPAVSVREAGALSGRLVDPQEVRALRDRMETWSQLILDAADPMAL